MADELLDASAVALAGLIRRRAISPLELVDAHIARIEEVNPRINALVADRFEAARAEARSVGEAIVRGGELPPFAGVPCTVKEFLAVAGMPQSAGIYSRRHVRATVDATVVSRVRAAGAIVLGVTNVPEGGLWMETHNPVYGLTRNPWDPARTAGGSTGGEAALIASGGSPFGIGADIGGSIRIPAAFCGIVGHKPTGRMVPNTGYWPPVAGEIGAYLVNGPMARRIADLWPLLQIMAGPDGHDAIARRFPPGDPAAVDLREVVVYPVESNGRTRVGEPMREAVRRAAKALSARGARVATLRTPGMRNAFAIWSAMLAGAPGASYAEVLGDGEAIRPLRELAKFAFGRSHHSAPALILTAAEQVAKRFPGQIKRWIEAGRRLQTDLEAELGPRGVLLHPPYTRPAPKHHHPMLTPFDFVCTAVFNVLEFPVTQVPMGFGAEGLPLGVQVAARRGLDHLTIAVAGALEEDFGGWVRAEPRAEAGART
ncbi:MAG: amidase [Myxococcales bacterium]|nr:amidase [Myxococcales bacterium]